MRVNDHVISLYEVDGERTVWRSPWTMSRLCMQFKHRTSPVSYHRKASEGRCLGEGVQGSEHHFQFPHVGFVPQVLFEVEPLHVLVDEAEGVDAG